MASSSNHDPNSDSPSSSSQRESLAWKKRPGFSKKIAQKLASNIPSEPARSDRSSGKGLEANDDEEERNPDSSSNSYADLHRSANSQKRREFENSEDNASVSFSSSVKSYPEYEIVSPMAQSSSSQNLSFDERRLGDCRSNHQPILPRISSQEVRKGMMKNYLLLKNRKHPVSHDAGDFEKCFPDGKVTIFVGTWNMAGQDIPLPVIIDWLIPEAVHTTADIYAVGIQEGSSNPTVFKEWESKLQRCLWPCKQVLFHSYSLGVQHLAVFVRRELIWYLSRVSHSTKNTRIVSKVKTKGAISIGFKLFGTTFLFISSHLSYGPDSVGRVRDYQQIVESLRWKNSGWHGGPRVLENVDVAFWAGDLNFRLEGTRDVIMKRLEEARSRSDTDYAPLLERDQLQREVTRGTLFHKFLEPKITFPPTYKYDRGTSVFDTSAKRRVPAYTDRILYRTKHQSEPGDQLVDIVAYDSVPSIKNSDHKPVYGIFRVKLKPGHDHAPIHYSMPTPKFNAAVFQAGLAHHHDEALHGGAVKDRKTKRLTSTNSALCSLM